MLLSFECWKFSDNNRTTNLFNTPFLCYKRKEISGIVSMTLENIYHVEMNTFIPSTISCKCQHHTANTSLPDIFSFGLIFYVTKRFWKQAYVQKHLGTGRLNAAVDIIESDLRSAIHVNDQVHVIYLFPLEVAYVTAGDFPGRDVRVKAQLEDHTTTHRSADQTTQLPTHRLKPGVVKYASRQFSAW